MPGSDDLETAALLPVKNTSRAKQRLSGTVCAERRAALACAMFRRTLGILAAARSVDLIVVLSDEDMILDEASKAGAEAWREESQSSHSESADRAVAVLADRGVGRVLSAPIDVPLLMPEEVDGILAESDALGAPSVVIAPSADGAGTNALVRSPPDVIRARFGPDSLALHREEARRAGARVGIHRTRGWLYDLDTPEDVERLAALGADERILRLAKPDKAETSTAR